MQTEKCAALWAPNHRGNQDVKSGMGIGHATCAPQLLHCSIMQGTADTSRWLLKYNSLVEKPHEFHKWWYVHHMEQRLITCYHIWECMADLITKVWCDTINIAHLEKHLKQYPDFCIIYCNFEIGGRFLLSSSAPVIVYSLFKGRQHRWTISNSNFWLCNWFVLWWMRH